MENEEFYTRDCEPKDLCAIRDIVNQYVLGGDQPMPYLEPIGVQPFFDMYQLIKKKRMTWLVFIEKKTEKLVGYSAQVPINRFFQIGND